MALRIHELFYDPLSLAYDEGRFIAPIGGHSDHVHVSFANPSDALLIIAYAQSHGLRVGENPYVGDPPGAGIHVGSSYHYRDFPGTVNGRKLGMAVDVTGTPAQMAAFATWVKQSFTGGTSSVQAGTGSSVYPPSADLGPGVTGAGAASGASCLVQAVVVSGTVAALVAAALSAF